MFVFQKSSYYQSTKLHSLASINHAYSTRKSGDLRNSKKRTPFFADIGLPAYISYIEAQQVHANNIARIRNSDVTKIRGVDGLVVKRSDTKKIALGVYTADCIGLLLADTGGTAIGAVHVGWKGAYTNIVSNAIDGFTDLGIDPSSVVAGIGPHIGKCCYSVPQARAIQFLALYGNDARVAQCREGVWYLDLGYVVTLQLLQKGLKTDNIDECHLCTVHNPDEFFSYRKDTKKSFGEMAAVIW